MLWFAWKIVPLWYQQQHNDIKGTVYWGCDLLEKLYLCGINNNGYTDVMTIPVVVICLKNCTFVVSTTTNFSSMKLTASCDLLEKLYLCGINNNNNLSFILLFQVVICLKNCTFVVSTTTCVLLWQTWPWLWFAWKIVPLWYQQQRWWKWRHRSYCCDLLEKLYLCGINNNRSLLVCVLYQVVICLKNCTFVVSTTTCLTNSTGVKCCDLLEKLYLCGINNNDGLYTYIEALVVICLKNCTFVVSTTTICYIFVT